MNRRRFLAGATAAAVLPAALRARLAEAAPASGSLHDVEHIVIFMQENRAFDHYFGTLTGVRGFGDRIHADTLRQPYRNPVRSAGRGGGSTDTHLTPFHLDTFTTDATCADAPKFDFPTYTAIANDGRCDRWNTARDPGLGMGHFRRSDLEFYYRLADEFTICDQYFQSALTQTNPNRLHLFTGANFGVLDNTEPTAGFTWTTYFERLERAGVSWRVYQETDNFDDNALAWFAAFKRAAPGSALHRKGLTTVPDLVTAFGDDIRARRLPQVSVIIAPTALSEHSDHHPADGEDLTARLLGTLAADRETWSKTVFLLNYDEGGGWFDHVPPPMPPTGGHGESTVSTTGEIVGGKPVGLGFRVPMIVVSPWSRGGWVCSQVFDHTSVLRFCAARFGVDEPNISPWRRTVTGDLTSVFDFDSRDISWPALPDTASYITRSADQCRALPAPIVPIGKPQVMPVQEPGMRKARPLPYHCDITAHVTGSGLALLIANAGAAGLHLLARDGGRPRQYTVGAGKDITARWSGHHDVSLYGPNGFHRRYRGPSTPGPEVTFGTDLPRNRITLTLTNPTDAHVAVTITPNAYDSARPKTYPIPPGATFETTWGTHNWWYDLTVTTAANVLRRFAGHIETGHPSTSDPAMG